MLRVHDRIARYARETPFATALLFSDDAFSYSRLESIMDCLASWLVENGLTAKDVVGLSLPDPRSQLLFSLALMRTGAAQSIIGATQTRTQAERQCRLAKVTVFIGGETFDNVRTIHVDHHVLKSVFQKRPPSRTMAEFDDDDVAFIFQGSGTTGAAKLLPITHRCLLHRVTNLYGKSNLGADQRTLILQNNATLTYMFRTLAALHVGGCVVANPTKNSFQVEDCKTLFATIDRYGVDHLHCTTYHAQLMVKSLKDSLAPRLPNLKSMLVGASTVSRKLRQDVNTKITTNLCINYGSNEGGIIARAWPDTLAKHPDAVGVLNPVSEICVFDNKMAPLPPNKQGLIWVKGPAVIDGYVGADDAASQNFVDGWYNTRDLGHLTPDGILYHHGRLDDVIIMAGVNVHPRSIERELEGHPAVAEVAVVGVPSEILNEFPAAFVVTSGECSLQELDEYCIERLGSQAPRMIKMIDVLPRNSAGKVERKKLADSVAGSA